MEQAPADGFPSFPSDGITHRVTSHDFAVQGSVQGHPPDVSVLQVECVHRPCDRPPSPEQLRGKWDGCAHQRTGLITSQRPLDNVKRKSHTQAMRKLPHGLIIELVAFTGFTRSYISRIIHERQDWRKAAPVLVRALYQHGWCPKAGRSEVRRHLNSLADEIRIPS